MRNGWQVVRGLVFLTAVMSAGAGSDAVGASAADKTVVAVMPTELMTLFFPVEDPALLVRCEQIITESIQGNQGTTFVDRANLSRVLAERKLALMGFEKTGGGAIISADVFVVSQTFSFNGKPCLRVQAIHGPTASLLGEMKLDVAGGGAKELAPVLRDAARKWWPSVVNRLHDARSKPVWILTDVQIGSRELWKFSEQVRDGLQAGLAKNEGVFCVEQADLTDAQSEMFMKLTGMGRPALLPYTAAADYVLEARLNSPTEMHLCVRGGGTMETLSQTSIKDADPANLLAAASKWVTDQAGRLAKPAADHPRKADERYDQWARQQARVELEQGKLIYDEYFRFRFPGGKGPLPADTPEGMAVIRHYQVRFFRHFRRAAQLDPILEEAAYQAAKSWQMSFSDTVFDDMARKTALHVFKVSSDSLWSYLQQFPRSSHYQDVLVSAFVESDTLFRVAIRPSGMSEQEFGKIKEFYLRRSMECFLEMAERVDLPGKIKDNQWGQNHLAVLSRYIGAHPGSDVEFTWLIQQWSTRFDKYPDDALSSGFVRLMVLAKKNDYPGFMKLLDELKTRWPDPKHLQWRWAGEFVNEAMMNHRWDNKSFWDWYKHRFDEGPASRSAPGGGPEATGNSARERSGK